MLCCKYCTSYIAAQPNCKSGCVRIISINYRHRTQIHVSVVMAVVRTHIDHYTDSRSMLTYNERTRLHSQYKRMEKESQWLVECIAPHNRCRFKCAFEVCAIWFSCKCIRNCGKQ